MTEMETRTKISTASPAPVPATMLLRQYFHAQPYWPIYQAMQAFTATRRPDTGDECWLLQHSPVYTLGLAGKPAHILNPSGIPVYHIDRGGQVTYHGPGQLVIYLLLDLKRRGLHVKSLVHALEQSIIDFLAAAGLAAQRRDKAPGVYVDGAKIAALGLRIRHGYSYHGLSLNVDMDLAPFQGINPCGYPGLAVTQLRDLGIALDVAGAGDAFLPHLLRNLGYAYVETPATG